jgi:hypothetical protein
LLQRSTLWIKKFMLNQVSMNMNFNFTHLQGMSMSDAATKTASFFMPLPPAATHQDCAAH